MTVVAWDGRTLAADKQSTASSCKAAVRKLRRINGCLVGGSGCGAAIMEHMAWLERGAHVEDFPQRLRSDDVPSILLVIDPAGRILSYENGPYPIEMCGSFFAIGGGRDFAIAAMDLGFNAIVACEVAGRHSNGCGMGVDWLSF
jgi:ATP-dependent protease HslVU (ClpYQ) peptidase subunit